MISYTDEIRYGDFRQISAWSEENGRLGDALQAVSQEFGDKVHTSGLLDYLVRFMVNPTDITVRKKVPNFFLVIVSADGIDTVTRVGNEEPSRGGALTFQEPWVDEICDRFRSFRQRLSR